jgi:hypothetical protein
MGFFIHPSSHEGTRASRPLSSSLTAPVHSGWNATLGLTRWRTGTFDQIQATKFDNREKLHARRSRTEFRQE